MKQIEVLHKNQCDGLISGGYISYITIKSDGLIHDFYINNLHVSRMRGEISGQKLILEDTTE